MEISLKSIEAAWLRLDSETITQPKPVRLRPAGIFWLAEVGEPKPGEKLVGYYNSRVPLSHLRDDCAWVFERECDVQVLA